MIHIWVCSKHEKKSIIASVFPQDTFQCHTVEFDTDTLGTFTPEKKRRWSQLDAALSKAIKAIELSNCDIGVGSEWSFHSTNLWLTTLCNELIVMRIRESHQPIIWSASWYIKHSISLELSDIPNDNIKQIIISECEQGYRFCIIWNKVKPRKRLEKAILRKRDRHIYKWINDYNILIQHIKSLLEWWYTSVTLEHDFRAMYHEERQVIIKKACIDAYQKYTSHCPQCKGIGRWIDSKNTGLPCELCHMPSRERKEDIYLCRLCGHTHTQKRTDKLYTDPSRCQYCNP